MRALHAAIIAALLVLHGPSICTADASEPADPREALVGTWEVVSMVGVRPNGDTVPVNFMKGIDRATGILVYGADGWMSVQLAGAGRPAIAFDDPRPYQHSPGRALEILSTYYAYYGPYDVDPVARTVTHHVANSLQPSETDHIYVRHYRVEGDNLILETAKRDVGGEQRFNRIVWRRLNSPSDSARGRLSESGRLPDE